MAQFNLKLQAMVLIDAIDDEDALAKARSILDTTKAQQVLMRSIEIAEIQGCRP